MIKPSVDYRQFRFSKLNTPEFSHVWLLLYWPLFGLGFSYVERFYPVAHYIEMHCALDDLIPFNEWFLIPYMFWFVYLIGAVAYTFFFDVPGFRRMMRFVMITYSVTLIIYFLFPTCQMLRPEVFPRDNALTRFIAGFYVFDTNTNVCPSLHVIGSMAAFFAFWYAPIFSKRGWRIASTVAAFFISISTVFYEAALHSGCRRSHPAVRDRLLFCLRQNAEKIPQRRAGCHPIRNFIRRSSDRFCGCFFYTALFPFSFAYIRA